jgi:uncharacterized membrane protein
MNWILTALNWYLVLLVIGAIFFPLTKRIFSRFSFDFGYPFSKTLAIIFLSYVIYVFGTIKILPFNRLSLIFILCLFIIINLFIYKKNKKIGRGLINKTPTIIIEELLFLASLLFWTFVRGQEPSLHSLEKFMDFGFINSILRTNFFPPKDIWYTNLPINYYYFGHLTGAVLIKLSGIKSSIGYNLILSTIFALGITQVFSLTANIIRTISRKVPFIKTVVFGLIGAFLVNLGGNLHTIYLFTSGYPNDQPIPFWQILSGYNPTKYWYPNATRFIPFTIHEFPSYSYVVADLHGHVFDIPFVLLTIAILFLLFTKDNRQKINRKNKILNFKFQIFNQFLISKFLKLKLFITNYSLLTTIFLGFLTAIHYMTNAFDGPIYALLTVIIFFVLFGFSIKFFINITVLLISFIVFSLPFSLYFTPFVNGIGVNCSPEFLTKIGKFGPFLFEAGKCQISPLWMLFVLWGFFWVSFGLFLIIKNRFSNNETMKQCNNFLLILFSFSIFLTIIPEFFYIKDIYPAHFRANTMFKLGYQAFIMMGIASIITFYLLKSIRKNIIYYLLIIIYIVFLFFPSVYPFFSVPSYYGLLNRKVELDGQVWLKESYPEDNEIIDYLNKNEKGQPVILEAQGDSYTDYERISSFTGLPTVAGWWVHEWLWRGSSDVVGKRIPDVVELYESSDINKTKFIIDKYKIKYIIISRLERQKYPNLNEEKWPKIGRLIFKSTNGLGALYQVNQ